MSPDDYRIIVQLALREDLGDRGDITTDAVFAQETARAVLMSKDTGILAGAEVFGAVFKEVDPDISTEFHFKDGESLSPGDRVATLAGKISTILTCERVALNFLSFLSGIATATHRYVERAASGGKAVILDTRKTLPGLRKLSKYAVTVGGGSNHRMGLYDMVMLKDNHIDFVGSIRKAVEQVRSRWGDEYRIEVECRTLEEVREALLCNVDVIMLDNMDEDQVRKAVAIRNATTSSASELEASGNMGMEDTPGMSAAGVDFISVGSLTHSVRSFDFSLKTDLPG